MFETRRPIILTSHSAPDAERDEAFLLAFDEQSTASFQWVVRPALNHFRALRCDVHPNDIRTLAWANHTVMVVQGS